MNSNESKAIVISFRVSAQEWKALKKRSQQSGTNISRLLRANLPLLLQGDQH